MQTQRTADDGGQVVEMFGLDARGRRRSHANTIGSMKGRSHPAKGRTYPPHPLTPEDVQALLAACTPTSSSELARLTAIRLRAMISVLWRSGLRASELCALEERDLNRTDQSITVRHGKGDKHGISGMDAWGWQELDVWLRERQALPFGAVFCVIDGPTAGRPIHDASLRKQLTALGQRAGLRRRVNPHAFRHSHAVDLWREGMDVYTIQNQLRHADLTVTARYLAGIDPIQLLQPVTNRKAPMVPIT